VQFRKKKHLHSYKKEYKSKQQQLEVMDIPRSSSSLGLATMQLWSSPYSRIDTGGPTMIKMNWKELI